MASSSLSDFFAEQTGRKRMQDLAQEGQRMECYCRYVHENRAWISVGPEAFRKDSAPAKKTAKQSRKDSKKLINARKAILDVWGEGAKDMVGHQSYYHVSRVRTLSKQYSMKEARARVNRAFIARIQKWEDRRRKWDIEPLPVDYATALHLTNIPEVCDGDLGHFGLYINDAGVLKLRPQGFIEGSVGHVTPSSL